MRTAGIPDEELGRVFEKFVRGRSSDAVRGSGLGLYICRQIVDAHGGRIWATSEHGVGATLTFSLPLAPEPAPTHEDLIRRILGQLATDLPAPRNTISEYERR